MPMQIIMPTLLFIGLTNIMGIQMLVPLGKEKVVLCSEVVGVFVDVVINILLIPKVASSGAAIGTLVAEISVFIVQYFVLKDTVKSAFKKVNYIAIISSILISSILSSMVKATTVTIYYIMFFCDIIFWNIHFYINYYKGTAYYRN